MAGQLRLTHGNSQYGGPAGLSGTTWLAVGEGEMGCCTEGSLSGSCLLCPGLCRAGTRWCRSSLPWHRSQRTGALCTAKVGRGGAEAAKVSDRQHGCCNPNSSLLAARSLAQSTPTMPSAAARLFTGAWSRCIGPLTLAARAAVGGGVAPIATLGDALHGLRRSTKCTL